MITLTDAQVGEIAKTGQLTTTKMFEGAEIIKKLNMKIAGTYKSDKKEPKAEEKVDEQANGLKDKNKVWDVDMDGLNREQKKKLRKKLAAKRRKANKGDQTATDIDKDEQADNEEEADKEEEESKQDKKVMADISNEVDKKADEKKQ